MAAPLRSLPSRPTPPPSPGRDRTRCAPALVAAAALLAFVAGCESTPKAANLDDCLQSYEAGHYSIAHKQATEALEALDERPEAEREDTEYLLGLCSYRLGDLSDAERRFRLAMDSEDERTAARARANLGLVHLTRSRPLQAAACFETAAGTLEGRDGAEAARYASIAYGQAGDTRASRNWQRIADERTEEEEEEAGNPETTDVGEAGTPFSSRPSGFGYALQIGAFTDRPRAERAASAVTASINRAEFGAARIVPRSSGRTGTLYLVQFGRFDSRRDAARARDRMGRPEYIVTPAGDATP